MIDSKYLGKPYIWGGGHCNPPTGQKGYDCSGFCGVILYELGLKVIGTTANFINCSPVIAWNKDLIQPGDCMVYRTGGAGHVVMVINKTTICHAPRTGDVIKYASIDYYWTSMQSKGGKIVRPLANSSYKR